MQDLTVEFLDRRSQLLVHHLLARGIAGAWRDPASRTAHAPAFFERESAQHPVATRTPTGGCSSPTCAERAERDWNLRRAEGGALHADG
jgi:hypothetical protein